MKISILIMMLAYSAIGFANNDLDKLQKTNHQANKIHHNFQKQEEGGGTAVNDEKFLDKKNMEYEAQKNGGTIQGKNTDPALYKTNVPTWK